MSLYYFEGEQVDSSDSWESAIKNKYNIENGFTYSNDDKDNNNSTMFLFTLDHNSITTIDGEKYIKENIKLYPYTVINSNTNGYAMQNKLALGVTGEKGNANYPIYATLSILTDRNSQNHDNFENGYTNFEFNDGSEVLGYLNDYKNNLIDEGYDVSNVDIINMKELNDLVKNISGKNLPLSSWYNASLNSIPNYEDGTYYTDLGDLKNYLSNDYKWLWGTTYWTKTFVGNINDDYIDSIDHNEYNNLQLYFVSTSAEVCYSKSECYQSIPRAGIRPLVTISNENIIYPYNIKSKTDGNGSIEVVNSAYENDLITFRVKPKVGYKLSSIKLTSSSGVSVTYKEENIINNNDGTVSVNSFTMPGSDVLIEASFKATIINPKTGVTFPITIIVLMLLVSSFVLILSNKQKQLEL